jgi:ketopantoate reductase
VRIRIVGPGAVGLLVGGLLAEAGHEITFAGRSPAHTLASGGPLRVVLPDRWLLVRPAAYVAASGPVSGEPAELVIVALRRDQLRALKGTPNRIAALGARTIGTQAGGGRPEAARLLFLNCGEEDTRGWFPDLYAPGEGTESPTPLHALTLWTAVRLQADTVELTSRRSVVLAPKHPLLKSLSTAFRSAGVEVAEADSTEPWHRSFHLWQQLFLPMALCHSTWDYFLSFTEGREIAARVVEEGLKTLEREGGEVRRLPVQDPQELLAPSRRAGRGTPNGRFEPDRGYNSLLQALLRGEKTEARELNERLVKRAAEVGVEAAWNWNLARKLGRVGQVGFYRGPAELYGALS